MSKKIISWLFVFIWFIVIFAFSASDGKNSTAQSKGITRAITEKAYDIAYELGIIKEVPTEIEMTNIVISLNPIIRKVAHVVVYFILALLIILALGTKKENIIKCVLITILICFLYAVSDEIHQTMVGGRDGKFSDCLIDTIGAVLACASYYDIMLIKESRNKVREEK